MLQHTCEVKNHFKLALETSKESHKMTVIGVSSSLKLSVNICDSKKVCASTNNTMGNTIGYNKEPEAIEQYKSAL
jgi:hypothetical protein